MTTIEDTQQAIISVIVLGTMLYLTWLTSTAGNSHMNRTL